MGREIRRVPPGWSHPREDMGNGLSRLIPLFDGYEKDLARFEDDIIKMGLSEALDDWGGGPRSEQYMLVGVPDEERTQYMMYEDTTEGTPISPAFDTPEEVARWCADNKVSSFGRDTASYEWWLHIAKGGYMPSLLAHINDDGTGKILTPDEALNVWVSIRDEKED